MMKFSMLGGERFSDRGMRGVGRRALQAMICNLVNLQTYTCNVKAIPPRKHPPAFYQPSSTVHSCNISSLCKSPTFQFPRCTPSPPEGHLTTSRYWFIGRETKFDSALNYRSMLLE